MTADSPLECSHWVAVTFWEENQNHLWVTFVGWFEVTDMSQFDVSLSCEVFIFYWMMCILCEESCCNTVESLIVVILVILQFEIEYECCATMFFWGRKFSLFFNMKIMSSTYEKDFCERSVPIHCHPSLRGLRLLCKFPHYDLHFTQDLIVKSRHSTFAYA
jgi:hypothetical protein